ncbi:MAG: GNAT family N-acetyltransferase [Paludibacteraceae bacterium]|nr:GNAT family N-acetyltransferase [Paludibacteraceae bacterium]
MSLLFSTYWWHEACGRGVRSRYTMRFMVMPQLTPYVELTDDPDELSLDYYYEQTAPGTPLRQDLLNKGFTLHQRRTFVIDDLSDIDSLAKRFSENKRRQIKRAANLRVVYDLTPAEFYNMHEHWLAGRGRKIQYSRNYFLCLADAALEHDAAQIVGLQGENGEYYAAAFLVYDNSICYYLVPTFNPLYADSGAGARLVLESLIVAKDKGCKQFDFEGGNNSPTIALHYSQFASNPVTYYGYEKYYNTLFKLFFPLYKKLFLR